jgi:O-antigen ligase
MLYSIIILLLSVIMVIYVLLVQKHGKYVVVFAILINVIPFFYLEHQDMNGTRFLSVPISYIPFLFASLFIIIKNKFLILESDKIFAFWSIVFIIYITFTSFLNGFMLSTMVYVCSYALNFILYLTTKNYYSKMLDSDHILKIMVYTLFLVSIVGIFKYIIGITNDTNFMPFLNRNATIIFIITIVPILFYIKEKNLIGKNIYFIINITFIILIIYMYSRSAILALILIFFLYYYKLNIKFLFSLIIIFIVFIILIYSGLLDKQLIRFNETLITINMLNSGVVEHVGDYKRIVLINAAIDIIKDNLFFGVGVGVDNYINAFSLSVDYYDSDKAVRAHNLYLTRLANFGLIGYIIFMSLMISIYRQLLDYKTFKIAFIAVAFLMIFNEYILLPELWIIFGLYAGIAKQNKNKGEI